MKAVTRDIDTQDLELGEPRVAVGEAVTVPTPDALFQALSKRMRRRVLSYLLDRREASVTELADVVAGWRATESAMVERTERERIAVELRHVHLPMLASAEIVEYDSGSGAVRLPDLPASVADLVRFTHDYERAVEQRE